MRGERTTGGHYEDEDDPRRGRLLRLDGQPAAADSRRRSALGHVLPPQAIVVTRMMAAVVIRR
jgi:hypothetical protein